MTLKELGIFFVMESLFNKVATLLKKDSKHRCFPVNIAKNLRTPTYFEEHLRERQLLQLESHF